MNKSIRYQSIFLFACGLNIFCLKGLEWSYIDVSYQGVQFVYGIFILVSQPSQANTNSEWDIPAKNRKCILQKDFLYISIHVWLWILLFNKKDFMTDWSILSLCVLFYQMYEGVTVTLSQRLAHNANLRLFLALTLVRQSL